MQDSYIPCKIIKRNVEFTKSHSISVAVEAPVQQTNIIPFTLSVSGLTR